ncbi:DUF3987 domain-containing protein [Phormidium nigroviride]
MTSILPNPDQVNQEWKIWNQAPNAAAIAAGIKDIPAHWSLTPLQDKASKRDGWENEPFIPHAQIADLILNGEEKISKKNGLPYRAYYSGFGLRAGDYSDGLLAIDVDGAQAEELLQLVSGGDLPLTVSWTSGKPGRRQLLYQIPEEYREQLKPLTHKAIREWGEFKSDCDLDFRYNKVSSVLPPSRHPETGSYKWINSPVNVPVAIAPDWLCHLVVKLANPEPTVEPPKQQQQFTPYENITLPVAASIPLEFCLARSSRELLNGVSEGGRNEAAAKLARDLIGTANYLYSINQAFDGDPQLLLSEFAQCCNPPLPQKEVESVWKSANSKNPTPASKGEGVENCVRGWYWNNFVKKPSGRTSTGSKFVGLSKGNSIDGNSSGNGNGISNGGGNGNSIGGGKNPPNGLELRQELRALIEAGTSGSALSAAILNLANGGNPQPIRRIYHEILEEIEVTEQRQERKTEVENLLEISSRRLDLENFLHPNLATPIKQVSAWMGVDPEAILTHLLPIAAGLINPKSRIVAKDCINFVEPFLLYSGVVALSGTRKTPLLNIVKSPLVKLQTAEDERYSQALQDYEAEVQAKKGDKDEPPPLKPKPPREFYVDNVTVEGLDKIKGQQPEHGFCLIKDELSGLFASHGAYKGGRGADKESFLSGWNGGGVKKNRAGEDSRVSLACDSLSVTGGIQPDKLRALLGDFTDAQGEWARFLWYHQPMRPYKIPRNNSLYSLEDLLEGLYKKLDSLPVLKLRFSQEGQNYFDDWHDEKDEHKRRETRPGLQAAIAKIPGQAVRLIGLLHILWEMASGEVDVVSSIPVSRVEAGCKLAEFYLGQVTRLQGDGDVLNGEMPPILATLLEKVRQFGSLTATQAKKALWALRKTAPDAIRQYFTELKAMGLAQLEGKGIRLALIPAVDVPQQSKNPDSINVSEISDSKELMTVDEVLMPHQQSENNTNQEVEGLKPPSVDVASSNADFLNTSTSGAKTVTAQEPRSVDVASTDINNSSTVDGDNLNETELEVVEFINDAISRADTKYAIAIEKIITSVCSSAIADFQKIWLRLGTQKQAAFTALLNSQL